MKNLLIAMTFILTFSFCQNKEKTSKMLEKEPVFRLSEHYSKFKFHDLKTFSVDTFEWGRSENAYRRLDSLAFAQILQDSSKMWNYTPFFYYSTFKDSTLIAILEQSEEYWGFVIWLLKYNQKGKLQNKTLIAVKGGDGGDGWTSYGKSIDVNNQKFTRTDILGSLIGDDVETSDEQIDSSIVSIKFDKNHNVKIDTLFKNQEIIKNKKK